jgi:hypothetical protein
MNERVAGPGLVGDTADMSTRTVKSLKSTGRISRSKARSVASALRAELTASRRSEVTVILPGTTASGSSKISFGWVPKSTKKPAKKSSSARKRA